jgi:hypothetical protein
MESNKKTAIEGIKTAKADKKYAQMLEMAQTAVRIYPKDSTCAKLLHEARAYYVNEKLSSKLLDSLEANKDWEGLKAIYLKLLGVFPESKKLHRLLNKVRRKMEEGMEKERMEYYKNAYQEIKNMMKQNRLSEAERAAYEVLSYNQKNSSFIRLLAKIQAKIDRKIEEDLSLYYKSAIPSLKMEYKNNKEHFIRI